MSLLAKEDTDPKIRQDANLNTLLGLIAKILLVEANSPKPFEPRHYNEAIVDPNSNKWLDVMKEEDTSLKENKT